MATVRCPNCQRALHLPDDREVQTAQCPLCGATFEAGHKAVPLVESPGPRAETILPIPPVPQQAPRELPGSGPARDFDFGDDKDRAGGEDRKKLQTAASWLKAMAGIGLAQMVLCGCCEGQEMFDGPRGGDLLGVFFCFMLVPFAGLCLVWSCAEAMGRGRSYGLVMTGTIVALILGGLMSLGGLIGCVHGSNHKNIIYLSGGVFRGAAGVCGVIGALLALAALPLPGVQAMFRRGGSRTD